MILLFSLLHQAAWRHLATANLFRSTAYFSRQSSVTNNRQAYLLLNLLVKRVAFHLSLTIYIYMYIYSCALIIQCIVENSWIKLTLSLFGIYFHNIAWINIAVKSEVMILWPVSIWLLKLYFVYISYPKYTLLVSSWSV